MDMKKAQARPGAKPSPGPLERYVRILEALAAFRDGLTTLELSARLALPKTTVNRLLHGLAASDLVVTNGGRNSSFVIGERLSRIIEGDGAWVEAATKRFLRELSAATGETSFIAREMKGQVRSVAMESPDAAVAVYLMPGHDLPLHATASGKLLLALNNEEIPASAQLQKFTSRTIVNRRVLAQEFRKIRSARYAVENGEHVQGLATLVVPLVHDVEDRVEYVLGITGPAERIFERGLPRHLDVLNAALPHLRAVLFHRADSARREPHR
jgi:DNA-binding IclR family transcriptional regulator